ncbi:MAG: hypothetical protein GY888_22440 [Planctomycetaceae bacterium]|nr:hypothetical protein [Planctomycetaceae bacterium]
MMLHTLRPWLACTMLTLLIPSWILAHPAPPSRQDESPAAEGSAPVKLRGRLPAHFGKVVDESQRQEIYQIQARYKDRIGKLQADLKSVTRQRDRAILEVLSSQQREELEELQQAARDRSKRAKPSTAPKSGPAATGRNPARR